MFTALVPPLESCEALEEFIAPRRDVDPVVRMTPLESWHITTAFAASVGSRSYDRLTEALGEVAGRSAPIDVTLAGAGAFPHPGAARVLYLAAAPVAPLEALALGCKQAFARAGIEVDSGPHLPHLTLARCRRPIEATRWLHVLEAAPRITWTATELVLIESHLRDRAQRYEVHERWPLGG